MYRKYLLITKDYDIWWSTWSNNVSSTFFKFIVKISQQSSKKDKITSVNESMHRNGVIETGIDPTTSILQKGKITNTCLKSILRKNKSSKDSQRAIKEMKLTTPLKKMPSKILKSLTMTSMEKDVEIEMLDYHDSIKTVEKERTQVQCTESIQKGTHSLTSGSSNQNRYWNRSKKRTFSDLEEISFTSSLVRVSSLKVIKLISSLIIFSSFFFWVNLSF